MSVDAATQIKNIIFEGNVVTDKSLLLREMYISAGDKVNIRKIEKSTQAIMNLGLFKSVDYYLREDYTQAGENLADLVILLEEKIYLLILPRLRVNEDETNIGIQLRWDNVFGLNHKMRLLLEDRGETDKVEERRQRVIYKYPNVNGSNYELNFKLTNQNKVDEIDAVTSVNRRDKNFGVAVFMWLNPKGRSRGWFAGLGFDYRLRENKVVLGAIDANKMDAMVIEIQYGFKDVHQYIYNRGGKEFGYSVDISQHVLGSNSEFFKHRLYYRSYYQFDSRPRDNLNVQALFGHSTSDILDDEAFSLGSSQGLRGYQSGNFIGNTMLLLNVEYMTPSTISSSLRYVYFMDIGNTYNDIHAVKDGNLKIGVGAGLRWKIQRFVKLDLRFDIGFGISDDEYQASFGTRHVF